VKALPKLAKAAEAEELAEALRAHLAETEGQVSRMEEVFAIAGEQPKGKPCKAMKGLIEEGNEVIKEEDEGELRDLAIIAACQRVEHYEISAYGTAKAIASRLGMEDAVQLLEQTEDEESQADTKLTEVAKMIYDSVDEEESMDPEDSDDGTTSTAVRAAVRAASRKPAGKVAAKAGSGRSTTQNRSASSR